MRILVCGGRNFRNVSFVAWTLGRVSNGEYCTVICGGATGGDALAAKWALSKQMGLECYEAEWEKYGRAAGPIRNQRMLDEGKPDVVVSFPGGRGTADMVRRATEAGIKVIKASDWTPS
jgi:hypothetical protein